MIRIAKLQLIAAAVLVAFCLVSTSISFAKPPVADVSFTGLVTCAHCVGIQPQHKGYTPWSWALYSVKQGDDIVLVAPEKTYKLAGDRDQLVKYIADKATVSGHLDGNTITVSTIARPPKA